MAPFLKSLDHVPSLRQIKVENNVVHAIEMSLGTFVKANFGTGTAIQLIVLKNGELGAVGIHAKRGYGVAPNRKDLLLESCRNMHQSRIVGKDVPGLTDQ